MKRVEVTWIDIISSDGWHDQNKLDRFVTTVNPVIQIGYLYEEDEDQIVLLDSYFSDKQTYGGIHTIPKGCIKSIVELSAITNTPIKEGLE
jgi:hypothetical protein